MEFKHQPQQFQKQKQTYIPNLLQGVHLLQLNRVDLSTYLANQILENPFIDLPEQENHLIQSALNETASVIEQTTASKSSLYDFLKEQIELFYRKTYLRELLFWWVNQLDHRGYVTKTVDEAVEETHATSIELVDALTLLQQLDPPGLGARDLRECLLLQTERLDFAPAIAYIIIEEHFDLLTEKKWSTLAEIYDVNENEIRKARLGLALFGLEVSRAFQFWIFISDTMKACIIHRKHFSPTLFATKPWGIRRISHIHHIKLFNNFFRYVFRYFTAPTNEFDVPVLVFLFRVHSS
ncbi:Sigma-54 factor, Activator interacting domain (AID) [Alkalibacterium gilvum]|uniref:Sigma-54 factor, Activator interacting domain (AID) n=1 Tax=Alkalibacterium gilvum TaxID=1130080 RepID=A0A1H6R8J1_9LACT|nr:hypothetical protein [Alkalibacterium gilvum]SEI52063.1 Sigma-54 factor, Activator interacting domain (AID) [Alkalibacterium gilvum]